MSTNDFEQVFTDEQLHKMSKENLAKVILLMRKQQSRLEEKASDLQKKQQLLEEKNKELKFVNALLSDRLSIAQRKRFGSSSEKYSDGYEQLNLFNEAEEAADPDAVEPVMEQVCPKPYKRKKQKGKKEQDLSAYPVTETIHYTLKGEDGLCPECGVPMKEVTTEITKTLKFIPAHFEVLEEAVHVYSCPKCSVMERAQKPVPFLKGSIATPSLVAGIMNAKYVNGMPLARQEREFKRYDLNLSTKTMANWVILCAQRFLEPLYGRMKEAFLQSHYAHCDGTRIQVLDYCCYMRVRARLVFDRSGAFCRFHGFSVGCRSPPVWVRFTTHSTPKRRTNNVQKKNSCIINLGWYRSSFFANPIADSAQFQYCCFMNTALNGYHQITFRSRVP